ncbi:MAG: hypothetical protein VX672_05300 [Planctomycetota bacterium]|nr:hypothetical protein [Planctomycetota bacterium]
MTDSTPSSKTAVPTATDAPEPTGWVESTQRSVALFGGIVLCGLVMTIPLGWMTTVRGVAGPSLLESLTPWSAIVIVAVCLVAAFLIAVIVARIVNPAVGTFVLGAGLAMMSMRMGTHLDLLFDGGATSWVAVETIVWSGVVLLAAAGLYRLAGPLPDQSWARPEDAVDPRVVFGVPAGKGALAGIVALVAVFLVATNDTKGQALFAATFGGIGAGMLGRVLAPRVQPVLVYAAPCIFLALGQVWALRSGGEAVITSWIRGESSPFGLPMPVDVAAGALMGVSLGIGWSRGFVDQHGSS